MENLPDWLTMAIGIVTTICYIIVQLRAVIPAEWWAKLPEPLIMLIERIAGNYRAASNHIGTDPALIRRQQT